MIQYRDYLYATEDEGGQTRGKDTEGKWADCLPHAAEECSPLSLLPLSIVLLSICFLPSSTYLSDRVLLTVLGLTSANRQGHSGRTVCVALCSHCAVSFLFIHKHTLVSCPILSEHFGDEDGFQSVLDVFLCARSRGQGRLRLTTELLHIPQQALLHPVPRKTAQDLGLERPYPAASEGYTRVCECVCVRV